MYFKKTWNSLSSPKVEGKESATISITPKLVVVEGMHDDDEQDRGENWLKKPLKGFQRWLCSFIWYLSVAGEGRKSTQLPLV